MNILRFCGEYEHTLDGKGRLSIPARFKTRLEESGDGEVVVLRLYFEGEQCVTIYGGYEWGQAVEKIEKDDRFNDDQRAWLLHLYQHQAKFVPLDEQGRVVIPPEAREYAGLKKDVMVVGDGNRVQVISRDRYRKVDSDIRRGADPRLLRRVDS